MAMSNGFKPENSVKITRNYNDSLLVEMRLIDSVLPTVDMQLFGQTFATPVMMAPLSHIEKSRPDGLVEIAQGAKAAGAVAWIGDTSEDETERVLATGASTVVVVKPFADNDLIVRRMQHAKKHGALAIGMDIDHPFHRNGGYDTAGGLALRPKTTSELKYLAEAAGLPFIAKGVLSAQDAEKCVEAGLSGIVVSHHNGIMDYAVPPLRVLPTIVERIGTSVPIFVDCEIASGIDAFKALALGATAVGVGRPLLRAMRENGSQGVQSALEHMTTELIHMMARTGAKDLSSLDPTVIWQA